MKLCTGILFFVFAALLRCKVLVRHGHYTQLTVRRLELPDIGAVKQKLDEAIKKYGWTSEQQSQTSIMVKANIGGQPVNFFEVSVLEKPQAGDNAKPKAYIVVSNLPHQLQDPTFARFHRHKLYARQTVSTEPGVDQKFLERYAEKFNQMFQQLLAHTATTEMFTNLKQLITEQGVQNVVMIERSSGPNSAVFDVTNKASGKLAAQAVVYTISDEYVGLSLSHRDDVSYFNIPIDNLKGSNPDILRVISDKVSRSDTKIGSKDVQQKITEKIRSLCSTNIPQISTIDSRDNSFSLRVDRSGQTGLVPPEQMCPFIDADVFVSHYSHGYMQYFHMMFNSRFLREEYVSVTTADRVDANIEKAFQMIKEDTMTSKRLVMGQTQEKDLKLEDLKKAFEASIGEAPTDDQFTEEETKGCTASGNKCEAKLKFPTKQVVVQLFINREGWVITATRILANKVPFTIQISTPLKNAGDQTPSIIQHFQQFMAEN